MTRVQKTLPRITPKSNNHAPSNGHFGFIPDKMTKEEQNIADKCTAALKRYYEHERLQHMVKRGEIHVKVKRNEIQIYGEAENHLIYKAATACLFQWKAKKPSRKDLNIKNYIQIFEPEIVSPFDSNEGDEHYAPSGWARHRETFYEDCDAPALIRQYGND